MFVNVKRITGAYTEQLVLDAEIGLEIQKVKAEARLANEIETSAKEIGKVSAEAKAKAEEICAKLWK